MGISLFGSKSKKMLKAAALENQVKIEALQTEIAQAREKLQESEANMVELQKQLHDYLDKEQQVAEVMIAAQINAHQMMAETRAKVEILLQEADEELHRKHQDLDLLRLKAQQLKTELNDHLDQCRAELNQMGDNSEETVFTPTLISRDKKPTKEVLAEIS
jgi:chromosome segregation ATPase